MDVQRSAPPARHRGVDGRMVVGAGLVLLVLAVASLAARGPRWTTMTAATAPAAPTAPARPPAAASTASPPPADHPPERENFSLPRWRPSTAIVVSALGVLAVALLAAAARYVRLPHPVRRGLRPSAGAPAEVHEPDPRVLAEAAGRALAQVDQPDAREAVVRSWLLLGRAAAEAGVPARPAETAAEYAARIATEFYVPIPGLTRLAELYREARFSAHEVGGPQRTEARNLLERLSEGLEHGRR